MNQAEFEKLYFKAKLSGVSHIGQLLSYLIESGEEKYALKLVQIYSPGATTVPTGSNISPNRKCARSPYKLCFITGMGTNIEQISPKSKYCIWCNTIYSVDLADPEITYKQVPF